MEKYDRLTGLIFLFLSVGICVESIRLSLGTLNRPGPGFISFIAGIAMGAFSLTLLIKNLRAREKGGLWTQGANKKGIGYILGSMFFYALLLEFLGFLATSILFFLLLSRFVAHLSWRNSAGLAVSSSLAAYLVFQVWLKTELPRGFLG